MIKTLVELRKFEDDCISNNIIINNINLNPKIIGGFNGNNHCWLNSSMYVIIAYWSFFRQFNNDIFLTDKLIDCNLKGYNNDNKDNIYGQIYDYLNKLSQKNQWGLSEYLNMVILLKKIKNIDLPLDGAFGNAQEFVNIFLNLIIFKTCPMHKIIDLSPSQIGPAKPFTVDKLKKQMTYDKKTYNYELIAILKPTRRVKIGEVNHGVINVAHWTAYVRNKNNNFLLFDMMRRGTQQIEISWANIFPEETGDGVYMCSFVYLNTDYIDEADRFKF